MVGIVAVFAGVTTLCTLGRVWADAAPAAVDYTKILPADLVKNTPQGKLVNPYKDTQDIFACRLAAQITPCRLEDKLNLLLQRVRFQAGFVHRRVGRPRNSVPMPRNHEQHSSIAGVRDHDRRVCSKE